MTQPPVSPADGPPPAPSIGPPAARKATSRTPWIITGISFVAIVALVAGLLIWRGDSGGNPVPGVSSPVANDGVDRAVGMLREKDPVCNEWLAYADELAANTQKWSQMDGKVPPSAWTAEQREVFNSAQTSFRDAADRYEVLLPLTKHIVLRELIAQSGTYWRAYADAIPAYDVEDDKLAGVASNFSGAVTIMCTAVPLVPAGPSDGNMPRSSTPDLQTNERFMEMVDPVCGELLDLFATQSSVLAGWRATDPTIAASQWTPEQRALNDAAASVITRDSSRVRAIAQSTKNPMLSDFLETYADYASAYADAMSTYVPDDDQLWQVAAYLGGGLASACESPR